MNNDSFFSMDKLVEFGLGMAMAQQMVQMMNQAMNQMQVPGSVQTIPTPQAQTFYVAVNGNPIGPITESEFIRLVVEKKVTKDSLAWMPGMVNWQPIEQIPAILRIIAVSPPPMPTQY